MWPRGPFFPKEGARMATMRPSVTVLEGGSRAPSPLEAAYDHFRLVLQGDLVSDRTLDHDDDMLKPALSWAADAGVRRFEDMPVTLVERYQAQTAARSASTGAGWRRARCWTRTRPWPRSSGGPA